MVISESASHIAECDNELPPIEKCDAESQVALSMLSALRYNLTIKNNLIIKLQADIVKLRAYLSTTQEQALEVLAAIRNKTTPDIQELLITCDGAIAIDCCEVYSVRTCTLSLV